MRLRECGRDGVMVTSEELRERLEGEMAAAIHQDGLVMSR